MNTVKSNTKSFWNILRKESTYQHKWHNLISLFVFCVPQIFDMDHYSLSSSTSQEIDLIYCQCPVSTGNYSFRNYCSFDFWFTSFFFFLTKLPEVSGPQSTFEKRVASVRRPVIPQQDLLVSPPPTTSTCRPPPCRSEDRPPRLTPSAPDASGNVRWGPASQFANAGARSWWCWRVPGCRPRPPQRSTSPWDRRGPGCGHRPGRPGTAPRGSAAVGMTARWRRSPFHIQSPPGSSWSAWPVSFPVGCLVRLRPPRQRAACGTRAASRRCEAESESGFVRTAVGRWGCWTLRWKAPGCLSCCPGDRKSRQRSEWAMTPRTDRLSLASHAWWFKLVRIRHSSISVDVKGASAIISSSLMISVWASAKIETLITSYQFSGKMVLPIPTCFWNVLDLIQKWV